MAEEEEYKSDPEEGTRSLAMRRREASDDEEESVEDDGDKLPLHRRSDDDSDGQGGVEEYRDDAEEARLEEEGEEEVTGEEIYEDEVDELSGEEEEDYLDDRGEAVIDSSLAVDGDGDAEDGEGMDRRRNVMVEEPVREAEGADQDVTEEKKENEPFAVPTAGAFYMHDDRFRNSARGRNKRIIGGRKLWESKDESKWGHDKFEEMSLWERRNDDGRKNSRGYFRGRGRNLGAYRPHLKGNRANAHTNSYNRGRAPKSVRGRGPRRYDLLQDNDIDVPQMQSRQPPKLVEKTSRTNSQRISEPMRNFEPDVLPPKKQVFTSSLSSASPPFYPSGSSNNDVDPHAGLTKRNGHNQSSAGRSSLPPTSPMLRERNLAVIGVNKLSIDDSVSHAARKSSPNLQPSSSSDSVQVRRQGSGLSHSDGSGFMFIQSNPSHNQLNLASLAQMPVVQRTLTQSRAGSSLQILSQRGESSSQASSHSVGTLPSNSVESEMASSSSESNKNKTGMIEKERGGVQGGWQGPFLHGGAQLMGAYGNLARGDQKFPGTPAILPVMQFAGQHSSGIGVPAVGMAFPGYVAPPQPGMGSSEMTWLPVLAGAGALGTAYCPPYLTVDGAPRTRSTGNTSFGALSKENNTSKADNEGKPSQKSESTSNGYEQPQQHKPRRYSKMNFGGQ